MDFNASILSLLTISENVEKVIFAFCKEVEDLSPETIHWYPDRGANGQAKLLWEEKKLKQWLLIGKDEEVRGIFLELIAKQTYEIRIKNNTVAFDLPTCSKIESIDDFVKIKDVCICGRNEYPDEYESKIPLFNASFLIGEENNCEYLEGSKSHDLIRPIYPIGLFGQKELHNYLEKNICAVFQKRDIYWSLQGDRKKLVNGNPKRYTGFIQATPSFRQNHQVCIRDIEGLQTLGETDINEGTGVWEMNLSESAYKGQFLLQDKTTNKFTCGEKFYLIKDINVETKIVNTVITDLYGRETGLTKKQFTPAKTQKSIWHSDNAPDSTQSEIELSDKYKDVLTSLGSRIIFNDPYFWGDVKIINNHIQVSKSQKAFINALITAIAESEIKEIIILGYWSRAKNKSTDTQREFIDNYKMIYKIIKDNFNKSSLFSITKFELVLSKQPFHDRYWLGEDDAYSMSNSINGVYESKELTIALEEKLSLLKIAPRILSRYDQGEKHNLIN